MKEQIQKLQDKMTELKIDFRTFPLYQFFREIGALKAYSILQSQASVININTNVVAVFLFEDEAQAALKWMQGKNPTFTYEIKPTKITRYGGF